MKEYYVYILTTVNNTVLYTGVTNDIEDRTYQHKMKDDPKSFTARYNVDKLVWCEEHNDINEAIAIEKEIKNWKRAWKIEMIEQENPEWKDLSDGWYD